jgi:15-cis-phytoene synthase
MNAIALCRQTLATHSKSFALASRLFPADRRDEAAVVYTFCRRWDDAIDLAPPAEQPARLRELRAELEAVYDGVPDALTLAAFQEVVRRRGIPREYPEELLAGMTMDVSGCRYATLEELLLYCHRVAGVVGLMMCHVMGVTRQDALRQAAHLGLAMQLTNICRDVAEDWGRGRLYVPESLLSPWVIAAFERGDPIPADARAPFAVAVKALLAEADRYYRSGDQGIPALSFRCGVAVRTARRVYAAIGDELAARRHDVLAGRAVVSTRRKLWLALGAALASWPRRFRETPIDRVLRFPHDVLPV